MELVAWFYIGLPASNGLTQVSCV